MPRISRIDDVLFPVEEHPVFVSVPSASGERRLPVPHKKAIVNKRTNRVLGVVGREYRLVTNREALDWALQCCRTVFPETKTTEWDVQATDAPGTGGHCFIDLAHNSTALDFNFVPARDRPDVFGPFIRVTNSYNGLRALSFDIGLYRKVCKNGLILPDSVIRFKFVHSQRNIRDAIDFEVAHERIKVLNSSFSAYMKALRDCFVARPHFEPLFCAVLKIRPPRELKKGSPVTEAWNSLSQDINTVCRRYADDLGENAYAVLNAVTDFASHPPDNRCVYRERHSMQRLAGAWVNSFVKECRAKDFEIPVYLKKLGREHAKDEENSRKVGDERPWS